MGDGRRDDIGPVHGAELVDRLGPRPEAARRGDRLVAEIIDVVAKHEAEPVTRLALDQVLPHLGRGGERRLAVEVDAQVDVPPGHVDLAAAEPRDAAHLRVDGPLHQGCGDRGVDRVAAGHQHAGARLGRLGLCCHDHAGSGRHRCSSLGRVPAQYGPVDSECAGLLKQE